jgi:hypothetical protein
MRTISSLPLWSSGECIQVWLPRVSKDAILIYYTKQDRHDNDDDDDDDDDDDL